MQLAGQHCALCKQNVLFDSDATWCAECSTIFHRDCIAGANALCPSCRVAYAPPERRFTYSRFCPECMRPNQPTVSHCAGCGARTHWDTAGDYERFVTHMRETS